MQTQRGMGASKVSAPSVGGTINIVTKGIDAKKGGFLSYAMGNDGYNKVAFDFRTNENYRPLMHVSYDVQCPALSLAPQIGFDLRLVSNVSLTFAADYRWGTYGKSRVDARYTEGPQASTSVSMANPMSRMTYSMGLKLDFPMRVINWSRTQKLSCSSS